mgnify:FL=1
MKDIYILAYAQNPIVADAKAANEVELIMPVVHQVFKQTGFTQNDIGFTCSGSCDYLQGAAFAFVEGLSAIQTNPPIKESHVEMDAAWALYESILKIQMGDAETALIYGFGKSSPGDLPFVSTLQTDPYYMSPLWPDKTSLAALQAQLLMNKGLLTKKDMYEALTQSISNAKNNPNALVTAMPSEDDYLTADYLSSPLSAFDCAPISDGASAMIIGTEEAAAKLGLQKIKISSVHHSIETSNFGARDLSTSESIIGLGKKINLKSFELDFAELHTQFTYEIPFIRGLLDLGNIDINLSGGPLAGNVMMAAGLDSIGKSFELLKNNDFNNGLAHASSGPCLQQNMLVHLEKIND